VDRGSVPLGSTVGPATPDAVGMPAMRSPLAALVVVVSLVSLVACSGGSDDGSNDEGSGATATADSARSTEPVVTPDAAPVTEPPATESDEPATTTSTQPRPPLDVPDEIVEASGGGGITQPLATALLPASYVESEYVFGGEATSFTAVGDTADDEVSTAEPTGTAAYRTRMIVRRPATPTDFSGTVLVEWNNVTAGSDTTPDWGYLAAEIGRAGHAWVGVSVQTVGVNGGEGANFQGGIVGADPARYGGLGHPGDAYAFDIYSQAGAAVREAATGVLGDLEPTHVIAIGESQSAIFLTTYINAIHPVARVYDGFLVHSRGRSAPAVDASRVTGAAQAGAPAVRIRTDLAEPTLIFITETDLTRLGYAAARQDDTGAVRTWEVAGTAHADSGTLAASAGLPRSETLGELIGCTTLINDGPQPEVLRAALGHLVAWVAEGTPSPTSPRIEVTGEGDTVAIGRDELGIARGGIRTPPVDAPLRVLSGDPAPGGEGFCFLFGQTQPLDPAVITERYGDLAAYTTALDTSLAAAVDDGFLLSYDAEAMRAAELLRAQSLGLT
jgi:hypothetical protein